MIQAGTAEFCFLFLSSRILRPEGFLAAMKIEAIHPLFK
jgi:hypothetical protein